MIQPGCYRHFKGGVYQVLFTALDVSDGGERRTVVYLSLVTGKLFTRVEEEFDQWVPDPNGPPGTSVPRFSYIGVGQ